MGVLVIGRRGMLGGAGLLVAAPGWATAATGKPRVVITTTLGAITVELEDRKAPLTCANFLRYVDAAKYDQGIFFRASRVRGAPGTGTIVASPGSRAQPFPPIAHESTTKTGLRHLAGTISLGRFAPGTATSNFFICVSPLPYLDAQSGGSGDTQGFAAFGRVVQGLSVVRRVHRAPVSDTAPFPEQKGEWLKPPVTIVSARRLA